MITIKEHNGKRVLSNYNYNAVEKEILRLTDELERTEEVINYLLKKHKINVKMFPVCYNLQDMFKKSLLHLSGYSWWEDNLSNLYNSGWVYHFNSIPKNQQNRDANYWIKRVYEELYG